MFADTLMFTDYTQANPVFKLQETATHAQAAGVISPTEVNRWLNDLEQANQTGKFFAAITAFCVSGQKP